MSIVRLGDYRANYPSHLFLNSSNKNYDTPKKQQKASCLGGGKGLRNPFLHFVSSFNYWIKILGFSWFRRKIYAVAGISYPFFDFLSLLGFLGLGWFAKEDWTISSIVAGIGSISLGFLGM